MTTTRPLVLRAITLAVALFASGVSANLAAATTPTPPPPGPDDTSQTTDPVLQEFVQSWALAPAGSLDPEEAGNRPELSYVSDPGSVIEDAVTLFNLGNVQLTFRVYATDAFNNDEGQFDLLPGDEVPTDAGSWVTFPQESITVPPGKQVTMPITITIPLDAGPGDHAGAIVASNETASENSSGQVVKLDRRTGTRLYLRVSGPLTPELAVVDVQTHYQHALNPLGGSADVTFRIENRGNVRLSGTATVSVAGPFGLGERKVTLADLAELLPGEDVTVSTEISDVPALLLASTTIRLAPTGFGDVGALEVLRGKDVTFAPPITVLMVVLALLFGLLARRSYRRHREASLPPAPVAEIEEQSAYEPHHQLT